MALARLVLGHGSNSVMVPRRSCGCCRAPKGAPQVAAGSVLDTTRAAATRHHNTLQAPCRVYHARTYDATTARNVTPTSHVRPMDGLHPYTTHRLHHHPCQIGVGKECTGTLQGMHAATGMAKRRLAERPTPKGRSVAEARQAEARRGWRACRAEGATSLPDGPTIPRRIPRLPSVSLGSLSGGCRDEMTASQAKSPEEPAGPQPVGVSRGMLGDGVFGNRGLGGTLTSG